MAKTLIIGTTADDDPLVGTVTDDLIEGLPGDDVIYGWDGNDDIYAGEGNDIVYGGAGRDYIFGYLGDDDLYGGEGNDSLYGGPGDDELYGGLGSDTYFVASPGDIVVEFAGEGWDNVNSVISYVLPAHFEALGLLGEEDIDGTGNYADNSIFGNEGNNVLRGAAGDDHLIGLAGNDVLIGDEWGDVPGADTLTGGPGDDTYVVNGSTDVVLENPARGVDTVLALIDYSLPANVENLTLLVPHSAAVSGTGNTLANTILGNALDNDLSGGDGADTLSGWYGDDRLFGGRGNDTLTGGPGADRFVFDTAPSKVDNIDRITDFSVADDTIWLENGAFPALGRPGTLAASAFQRGASARDADDRIIYDPASGTLSYDADGNGPGSQIPFATLASGLALTNADFVVF